jgi:RHS repeat-associated protein
MGAGFATNTVTVNSQATYRKGEYFRKEVAVAKSSVPVWQSITVSAAGQTNIVGNVLVPRTNESFWHDSDGNLLSDSLWTNTWNSENRLVGVESAVNVPGQARMREEWTHLPDGRWIQRIVSTNSGGVYYPAYTNRFVWDRQVLLAILDHTNGVVASFMRGSDLSGSIQGAGGVGGVLAVNFGRSTLNLQPSTHMVSYDGNGNVVALHSAADGAESAAYEYGPFSEPIRVTGPVASLMPLRFSTMFEDNVTGDRKYLFRDYTPSTGRGKSRDPIEEQGGVNLLGFVGNDAVCNWDRYGLWWLDPSHAGLTKSAWEELDLGAHYPECPSILTKLVKANEATDGAPYNDMEHLAYHYNRKVGEAPNNAKWAYIRVRIGLKLQMLAFQLGDGNATREECSGYMENYGRLLHMSQDYYGHAVANAAVDHTSDVGELRGNPDNLSPDSKPSSYAGFVGTDEHGFPPRDGEPGTRNGQQEIRTRQTIAFTKRDMTQILDAYYARCKCYCKQ